ncbi:phosphoethanolamine transferase [Chitinibacter fontanus]|uniref:Phosphoethanolamine transferase n=1 Tax=Chitinibacter fontanus TaxID=1737446 RepID=A0A7D5V938_9NEIS|nr:phosphoethanolamine transferase [Chitinibacter fontanus]QLI81034.1 phosphoethanolamine transferase [Chitinibacter fontanus]
MDSVFLRDLTLRSMAWKAQFAAVWPYCLLVATLGVAITVGHDDWRVGQVFVLALPAPLLLLYQSRSQWQKILQLVAAAIWAGLFIVDGAIRAYLLATYQALPNSALVLAALANTNPRESIEYLHMYQYQIYFWAGFALLALLSMAYCLRRWWRGERPAITWGRASWTITLLLLALIFAALALKPWRRYHPVIFWPMWWQQLNQLEAGWADMTAHRAKLLSHAQQTKLHLNIATPNTLVVVISDSVNRQNLSLYGYPRLTSPQMQHKQGELGQALQVVPYAWSSAAATVPALRNFFYFGEPEATPAQHLLAIARDAGYKIWWISNHDDVAIEQEHARFSHAAHFINSQPGRSAKSLDQQVKPLLQQALADAAAHKLIIVHLLGAHPHYRLRYPATTTDFGADTVEQQLQAQGRSAYLRTLRREYDAALRYHDQVMADLLALTQTASGERAWLYFSDHGQEVAHTLDHAGHSQQSAAGYRIPLMIWQSQWAADRQLPARARSDWLAWTVLRLLHLDWQLYRPECDLLHPDYQWQAPALGIPIDFDT